jgi:hypothetical protein
MKRRKNSTWYREAKRRGKEEEKKKKIKFRRFSLARQDSFLTVVSSDFWTSFKGVVFGFARKRS